MELLSRFRSEFLAMAPHHQGDGENRIVANATPLTDITKALVECAKSEYGIDIGSDALAVYGKFDSKIFGGSVKARPALRILEEALASGKLTRGGTVFEATSGNFGIALGVLTGLGFDVVVLVSRRLQRGVLEELRARGMKIVNLDGDICPAPGLQGDSDLLMAKGVAMSVRQQLSELGFNPAPFNAVMGSVEALLASQDAIGLAKLLAKVYGGFCPSQYDNELNVGVHETLTAPEIDQQLRQAGLSLGEADVVCAVGTGGTATGISRYVAHTYGRRAVRVVFPLAGQDVAGIRTKEKAVGLKFYLPTAYLAEHEVDFEDSRKVMAYFNRAGYDVGESGALALYATIQLVNYGASKRLVVMIADGESKYVQAAPAVRGRPRRDEVTLQEAVSAMGEYGAVVWTHNMFVPKKEGLEVIASSLGCDESAIKVAKTTEVQDVLNGKPLPKGFEELVPADGRRLLFVCMAGNTSLLLAKALSRLGVDAESLVGGITRLPASGVRQPFELVQVARN